MEIFIIFTMVTIHLAERQVLGAYPFNHDILRATGISPPKRWLIFMEYRIQRCMGFYQSSANRGKDLISVFQCLIIHQKRPKRCYYSRTRFNYYLIISDDMLQFKNNRRVVAQQNCQETAVKDIHVYVHNLFHINFTVTSLANSPVHFGNVYRGQCDTYDEIFTVSFNKHSEEICGTRYPWSIYIPFNEAEARIRGTGSIPFEIIMGEVEVMDRQFISRLQGSHIEDLISWGHFKVQKYFITVEMLFRIRLFAISGSRVVIYDGPRPLMPKLSPYENIFDQSHYVSSTFQVVVVYAFVDENFTSEVKYNTDDYVKPRKLMSFNLVLLRNNSGCGNLSILSWMCTFNIISSRETQASVKIIQLDFSGPFADTHMSGGVAIYNVINNRANLVVHLSHNYDLDDGQIPLSITGSENELYISVYAYSPYTLLSLKFIVRTSHCIGIFTGEKVRPSLATIPYFIEEVYIQKQPRVKFHITLNIIGQCYIIHVAFPYIEPIQFKYTIFIHFKECTFMRLHYNHYSVDSESVSFWASGKFQQVGGHHNYRFCKVFGDICRFAIHLLYPYSASDFVATVGATQMECVQPWLEMCDVCKYLCLDFSMNHKYFVSDPNEFIMLERIRGNHSLVVRLSSLSRILSGGHDIAYSMQPFTFRYPSRKKIRAVIEPGEHWRILRASLLSSDAMNYIGRQPPRIDIFKSQNGGYEYILVVMQTDYDDQQTRIKDWLAYDVQCSKYDATFLRIHDYEELRFIVKSIMQPFLMERIYISRNYMDKVWFLRRMKQSFDIGQLTILSVWSCISE